MNLKCCWEMGAIAHLVNKLLLEKKVTGTVYDNYGN